MLNINYIPPQYQQNDIVAAFRGAPRFDHSNDFSKLFSSQVSDRVDYSLGTIFIGAFIVTAFIVWIITLIIFQCLGRAKVGFLTGHAMTVNKYNKQGCCTTVESVRFIFVISCLVVIGMTVLSTFYIGFDDLKTALDTISQNTKELQILAQKGQRNAKSLKTYGEYSNTVRDIILPDLRYPDFCVNTALDDLTGENFNATRQLVVDNLESLGDFNADAFDDLSSDLLKVKTWAENTWNTISVYGIQKWQLLTYVCVYCTIAAWMLITTILTWAGKPSSFFICMSTWFLLPSFIVFVILSWIIVSGIGVIAVMNADYCTGGPMLEGPDMTNIYIIERLNLGNTSEILFDTAEYFINGCESNYPFQYLENYRLKLNESTLSMNALMNMIESVTIPELERICGVVGDFDSIELYFDRLKENFAFMSDSASNITDSFSCESVNSLYVDTVHDNVCTDIPYGIFWAFASLLIVSYFGMIMVTLRSSWLEVKVTKPQIMDEMPIISVERVQNVDGDYLNTSSRSLRNNSERRTRVQSMGSSNHRVISVERVQNVDGDNLNTSSRSLRNNSERSARVQSTGLDNDDEGNLRVDTENNNADFDDASC